MGAILMCKLSWYQHQQICIFNRKKFDYVLQEKFCGKCILGKMIWNKIWVIKIFLRLKIRKRPCFNKVFFMKFGGGKRDRTADLLHAMQALYQLSYTPNKNGGESGIRTPDTRIMIPLL